MMVTLLNLFINYLVNLSNKINFIDKKYKNLEWYIFSHNGGSVENQFIMRYISKKSLLNMCLNILVVIKYILLNFLIFNF